MNPAMPPGNDEVIIERGADGIQRATFEGELLGTITPIYANERVVGYRSQVKGQEPVDHGPKKQSDLHTAKLLVRIGVVDLIWQRRKRAQAQQGSTMKLDIDETVSTLEAYLLEHGSASTQRVIRYDPGLVRRVLTPLIERVNAEAESAQEPAPAPEVPSFHVVLDRPGRDLVLLTQTAVTEREGRTIISKQSGHGARLATLDEVMQKIALAPKPVSAIAPAPATTPRELVNQVVKALVEVGVEHPLAQAAAKAWYYRDDEKQRAHHVRNDLASLKRRIEIDSVYSDAKAEAFQVEFQDDDLWQRAWEVLEKNYDDPMVFVDKGIANGAAWIIGTALKGHAVDRRDARSGEHVLITNASPTFDFAGGTRELAHNLEHPWRRVATTYAGQADRYRSGNRQVYTEAEWAQRNAPTVERTQAPAPTSPSAGSWKPEVHVGGSWSTNNLRFATEAEAAGSARALMMRWFAVTDSRAARSTDPVNSRRVDGRDEEIKPDPPPEPPKPAMPAPEAEDIRQRAERLTEEAAVTSLGAQLLMEGYSPVRNAKIRETIPKLRAVTGPNREKAQSLVVTLDRELAAADAKAAAKAAESDRLRAARVAAAEEPIVFEYLVDPGVAEDLFDRVEDESHTAQLVWNSLLNRANGWKFFKGGRTATQALIDELDMLYETDGGSMARGRHYAELDVGERPSGALLKASNATVAAGQRLLLQARSAMFGVGLLEPERDPVAPAPVTHLPSEPTSDAVRVVMNDKGFLVTNTQKRHAPSIKAIDVPSGKWMYSGTFSGWYVLRLSGSRAWSFAPRVAEKLQAAGIPAVLVDDRGAVGGEGAATEGTGTEFDRKLAKYLDHIRATIAAHHARNLPNVPPDIIDTEKGQKYVKIVKGREAGGRSVFGFVNTENGDLLKAASWKGPAKGARGNLYDESTWASSHSPWSIS